MITISRFSVLALAFGIAVAAFAGALLVTIPPASPVIPSCSLWTDSASPALPAHSVTGVCAYRENGTWKLSYAVKSH